MQVAKVYQDKFKDIKKSIEDSREYFDGNCRRYHEFMKFVFRSSMTQDEISALQSLGKPTIEFNILEAFVSRLRGEFAKQQPSLTVRATDGVPLSMLNRQFIETLEVVEAHLRAIFFDGANDKLEYNIYSDLLAGGFSVMRVFTDYVSEMSFEQNIFVDRVFDPTLTGFDPLARDSHKGDGRFAFELYPMTRDEFEDAFGKSFTNEMKFHRSANNLEGFNWSYKGEKEDIALVADYYCKEAKKEKIIKLSNGHVVTTREYDEYIKTAAEQGIIEQPPVPVGKARTTFIEQIEKYIICETGVLKHDFTNYKHLPLVFIDGNSVNLSNSGTTEQMTRPYVYHAVGIQRLKNFAGQSLANELENMLQSKFVVAKESIPKETMYVEAYTDIQKASTIVYNHFLDEKMPEVVLPPPREVQRAPIPPQISDTFRMSDEMTQAILGSYDNAAGMANAQMSGIAFARSAMQSNNASLPYIVGYIKGLNRVAQIIVDLIPKYYRTPRSLPVLRPSGKREYVEINKKGSLYMDYDPDTMQVKVETGVNFAMQKEIALQTVTTLMQSSELFSQFMNENGLEILLDNIDIRGIDELKEKAGEFMKQRQQQSQQAQQMQQVQQQGEQEKDAIMMAQSKKILESPTPEQVEVMRIQQRSQTDAAEIAIKEQKAEADFIKILNEIRSDNEEREIRFAEISAENMRSAVEQLLGNSEMNMLERRGEEVEPEEPGDAGM